MSSSRIFQEILLMHLGGSTKMVQVLRATPILKLEIRWDFAGVYVLDLNKNQLKDSRLRRGGQSVWRAADLVVAKQIYWKMIQPTQAAKPVELSPAVKKAEERSRKLVDLCSCGPRDYCTICHDLRKQI